MQRTTNHHSVNTIRRWMGLGLAAVLLLGGGCARLPAGMLPPLPASDAANNAGPNEPSSNEPSSNEPVGQGADAAGELQPYEDVITPDAVTEKGLFTVHTVGGKSYFEIPADLLGQDVLWHAETGAVPQGLLSARELGNRLIRFERRNHTLFIQDRTRSMWTRAGEDASVGTGLGVAEVTLPITIRALPVVAEGDDGASVVDVTSVFSSDLPEFSPRPVFKNAGYRVQEIDNFAESRSSYVRDMRAFPANVDVRSVLTFPADTSESGDDMPVALPGSITLEVRHSFLRLPAQPMRPRYADARVGYFANGFSDFSYVDDAGVVVRGLINRYRLEKLDPSADVAGPVQPIVFYMSRAVPEKWRPYVRAGVEAWLPVFTAAGFSNAIVVKDAPTTAEDADWSPYDARYSVIHWEVTDGAYGEAAPVADPRSGEILFSRIYLSADLIDGFSKMYYAMASALDPRAQKFPIPSDLQGELLQDVVTHEVGHTLGLAHNFKASQAYTIEQLRDPAFVAKNGITASTMAYSAYNYVAQPEDGIASQDLIPRIGPYDYFAIKWGYAPIANAATPAAEQVTLDEWAAEQLANPWLRYDGDIDSDDDANDPTVLQFNLGSDRLVASQLGLRNIERALGQVVTATESFGHDYQRLFEVYNSLIGARAELLQSVTKVPGGVVETRAFGGRTQAEFAPVPVEDQRAAVRFVLDQLRVPEAFLRPDITYRIRSYDIMEPLLSSQQYILESMLYGGRYRALADLEIRNPAQAYTLMAYLGDIQSGLWSELFDGQIRIHPVRRALQRYFLDIVTAQFASFDNAENWALESGTDFRAAARANLRSLLVSINTAIPNAADSMTLAHLEDARDQIEKMLKI